MDDNCFDRSLSEELDGLPPSDDTAAAVTPWGCALDRITAGLVLTSFTLHFLWLQFLLPAVGVLQLYLGFRTLRTGNRWFRACWIFSICKVSLLYCSILLSASPFLPEGPGGGLLGGLNAASTLLLYACFRQALRRAHRDVGQPQTADPALGALIWYTVLLVLALLLPNLGWWGAVPMLIAFVCIIRSLSRVASDLDQWGYAVPAAAVKVSDHTVSRWWYGTLLVLTLAISFFSCHTFLREQPVSAPPASGVVSDTRGRLADLGFPSELLSQLSADEIQGLGSAVSCSVGDDMAGQPASFCDADTVYVRLDATHVRIYHFFSLRDDVSAFWQNRCGTGSSDLRFSDGVCRLRFTRFGQAREAAVPVEFFQAEGTSWFGQSYTARYAAVRFSYPLLARQRTGYMAFTAETEGSRFLYGIAFDYYRQRIFPLLPYRDLWESRQGDSYQHYTTCEDTQLPMT